MLNQYSCSHNWQSCKALFCLPHDGLFSVRQLQKKKTRLFLLLLCVCVCVCVWPRFHLRLLGQSVSKLQAPAFPCLPRAALPAPAFFRCYPASSFLVWVVGKGFLLSLFDFCRDFSSCDDDDDEDRIILFLWNRGTWTKRNEPRNGRMRSPTHVLDKREEHEIEKHTG